MEISIFNPGAPFNVPLTDRRRAAAKRSGSKPVVRAGRRSPEIRSRPARTYEPSVLGLQPRAADRRYQAD